MHDNCIMPKTPKNGPVMIVDENAERNNLVRKALDSIRLSNNVELYCSAEEALKYLETTTEKPFLILCNTVLPGMGGLEFQKRIFDNECLRDKGIPLIFFSDSDAPDMVGEAYMMRAQGYFLIPKTYIQLKMILFSITDYWQRAVHPSSVQYKRTRVVK